MKTLFVIDCGSSKVPEIEKILSNLHCKYNTYSLNTKKIPVENASGIIISGAPILLTQTNPTPYLTQAKILFQNAQLPVLGICFGHQLMGMLNGATIHSCNPDRDWQAIHLHKPFDLLPNNGPVLTQKEDHCEAITLPPDFLHIGSSTTCTNEIMQHHTNPWYGVQFHPEVSGPQGVDLIATFVARCNLFA